MIVFETPELNVGYYVCVSAHARAHLGNECDHVCFSISFGNIRDLIATPFSDANVACEQVEERY